MHPLVILASGLVAAPLYVDQASAAIGYRVSLTEPHHHVVDVEATFSRAPKTLHLFMSRSSPGRYAVHDFARGVVAFAAYDGQGRVLTPTRPNPHQWNVSGHDGTVRVVYRVYGTRLDGTNLAVDSSHAHLSMPATFLWAKGLEKHPISVVFTPPKNSKWKVATQLYPTTDPYRFTAPNLQYFMDSPTELSDFGVRSFKVRNPDGKEFEIRAAVHHDGPDAALDEYIAGVEKICREQAAIFGEYPEFETGRYTFIGDYVPWGGGAGMEHRNSTVVAAPVSFRGPRAVGAAMGTVSHEFFHAWNVERIRPKTLEPFDLTDSNISGELWLAEGFTQYYGILTMARAGLQPRESVMMQLVQMAIGVANHPARGSRSPVEMSRLASFVDGTSRTSGTALDFSYIDYYSYGATLALALDMELRIRSNGKVTLDDFMRALWISHGKPSGEPGYVPKPYTLQDVQTRLGEVSGDPGFADEFFRRYIFGGEMPDFAKLLRPAGFVVQRASTTPWTGMSVGDDGRVTQLVIPGTPAYRAGLQRGDVIVSIGGKAFSGLSRALEGKRPGDVLTMEYRRPTGITETQRLILEEDPRLRASTLESTGAAIPPEVSAFRAAWLSSRVR